MAKTAIEKRDGAAPAKVELLTEPKGNNYPPGKMLVATPLEIDAIIRRIPKGRVLTMGTLRDSLAKNHKADYTCPITTGIFLRIVAEASEEERTTAGARLVPYWRVVRDDGTLIDKLPGGVTAQADHLAEDGVMVMKLSKVPKVMAVDELAWTPPPLGKKPKRL